MQLLSITTTAVIYIYMYISPICKITSFNITQALHNYRAVQRQHSSSLGHPIDKNGDMLYNKAH